MYLLRRLLRKKAAVFSEVRLRELEERLGYCFREPLLLEKALRHRSSLQSDKLTASSANEQLEFLGDAVLGLVTAEYLFRSYPREDEGKLTKYKSVIVSGLMLSKYAAKIGLGDFILMGSGEIRSGGRTRPTILEDAFEAAVGAIYLDGGLKAARRFIESRLLVFLEDELEAVSNQNFKSELLEYAQSCGLPQPFYSVVDSVGPDHHKTFIVQVSLEGRELGKGSGRSKKSAEQRAAQAALMELDKIEERKKTEILNDE